MRSRYPTGSVGLGDAVKVSNFRNTSALVFYQSNICDVVKYFFI